MNFYEKKEIIAIKLILWRDINPIVAVNFEQYDWTWCYWSRAN